tara:strand:- start:2638 stop:3570 length:933 start_codon:yes stop_codon:yes gene_type:complete
MREFLEHAVKKYYEGDPIISDEQFDVLADVYKFNDVGHQITDGVPHIHRMYSLQKFFDEADAPDGKEYVVSPKLDGAAVSLVYIKGELQLALTRGDGIHGKDVTDKMQHKVPLQIQGKPAEDVVQITGELVAPKTIPNARNYAAGALNLKDPNEFLERNVSFVAYDMQPSHLLRWTGTLEYLFLMGFATVMHVQDDVYPTDGLVYRMNENKEFDKQGYTSHHPRGAFALKEKREGVITKLVDVIWQTGKSGVVTPVGILDPVTIGDAVIQKATLHNIDYIRSLNLEIGCKVEVIRSGEIIPRILRRVDEK